MEFVAGRVGALTVYVENKMNKCKQGVVIFIRIIYSNLMATTR